MNACLFVLFTPQVADKVKKKKQQTPSSDTVMDLVSTKRQKVTKQGRLGPGKSKATAKDQRIKSAVGQYSNTLLYILRSIFSHVSFINMNI